jgi:hypothetical protein
MNNKRKIKKIKIKNKPPPKKKILPSSAVV